MIADSVVLGENVSIPQPGLVNLYGCRIGDETRVGQLVKIAREIGSPIAIADHANIDHFASPPVVFEIGARLAVALTTAQ